ncbi:MAG: amidohydrolase family protein [Phycisphaeraceae bacterium]|nr:amidohydrolase family protein [Phycisphaeraceae bacterium]
MKTTWCAVLAGVGAALGLTSGFARAQEKPIAFVNARVIPIEAGGKAAEEIERGVVVVQGGKIVAIETLTKDANYNAPSGTTVIDCKGKVIMPGIVDTHSHVGGIGGADGSATIQPSVRISDSLNPFDSGYRRVVAGGLTTINVMPGSGHLMSGQTLYMKMRMKDGKPAHRMEDLAIFDENGSPMGGMKMANGTNSLREPPFSGTRGKSAAMVREVYIKAQEYQKKWKEYDQKVSAAASEEEKAKIKAPARDLGMDALVEVLEGKRIVHHHTHRADDIATVIRIAREFGYKVVLHHTSEAWKIPEEIAQAQKDGVVLGCSIIQIDSPGGKLEAAEKSFVTGGVLERAGVRVGHHTDDWINDSRLFLRCAAIGVRAGMTRAGALRGLTLSGAEMLGLEKRVGSLEAGKDADLVILSGDPLSVYTHVEQTWVDGNKVFDRSIDVDYLHAVGGFGAGRDQEPYFCCFGQ